MSTMTLTLPAQSHVTAPPQRLLTGPVLRLFAVDFAAMSSFYLLLSVVPLYSTERSIGSAGAGLSTGVLMFASVAAEIATPALASRLGYRRLLMAGLVLLGAPALALPAVTSLAPLMAVSVVRGLGFAIVVVAVGAMAATAIPEKRRGEGLGVLGVVAMLPAVVTLPLGVWLVGHFGYPVVFAAAAAAALASVALVATLPEGAADDAHSGSPLAGMRRPAIMRPALVFAATAVAGGVVVAFLPSAVHSGVAVPALFVQSAAATLTRWLAGRHSDRHGAAGLLVPAVVVTALGMSAAAAGSSLAVLAGMAVFGAGFGLAQSATLNTMLQGVPSSQYGAVSAAWNAAYDLGWGAGAVGIGELVSGFGYPAAFAATAALVLAALPLARNAPALTGTAHAYGPRRACTTTSSSGQLVHYSRPETDLTHGPAAAIVCRSPRYAHTERRPGWARWWSASSFRWTGSLRTRAAPRTPSSAGGPSGSPPTTGSSSSSRS